MDFISVIFILIFVYLVIIRPLLKGGKRRRGIGAGGGAVPFYLNDQNRLDGNESDNDNDSCDDYDDGGCDDQ
ncbi:hypothetical protein [Natranaerofaba carboxydovora]|uniref:hypothetical protein n=1 Tax=Natranaerofaba carboxydovora TaxID=2742683 RepID=UPI001F12F1A9|nr:hypothetical protein [Natranaerofaba carboxydovora]UMZ73664.1 hypothetical protein ACONDI_01227 [Natranaerofaba carboxydovora]